MSRVAVVLFNLGGPDSPAAVQPFLFNLFNDPAIIGLPGPIRWLLAKLLAARRVTAARAIYAHLGGASPLLANTQAQADALAELLADLGQVKVFPCMRYWRPMSDEVAARVKAFAPDEIVLLPLYPQFSTTTTASSLAAWRDAASKAGLTGRTRSLCCYPVEPGFIAAAADVIRRAYWRAQESWPSRPARVLFSAHGLPRRVIERGDPYQSHVESTAAAIAASLGVANLDWRVCYQSRVGPLEWIGPYTEDEISRAAAERIPVVVAPIAFVSEHSETLVELDIEYRRRALAAGAPHYERAATVGTHPKFIAGLAQAVRGALALPGSLSPVGGVRICAADRSGCALVRG